MVLLAGVLAVAVQAAAGAQVEALQQLWSGIHDSSEQVVSSPEGGISPWPESGDLRVRTIVSAVELPWLGRQVLYLEEFLHDDPENLRRQLLVQLEPAEPPARAVRAHLFTFSNPRHWIHLSHRPQLLASLRAADIVTSAGCDLLFTSEGDQFRGGTVGRRCPDTRTRAARYLDYQLVIGTDLYWYRRRIFRRSDAELQEEVVGYNWFEAGARRSCGRSCGSTCTTREGGDALSPRTGAGSSSRCTVRTGRSPPPAMRSFSCCRIRARNSRSHPRGCSSMANRLH